QKGEILEDLGAGEYQVQVGSLKMKVGRNDLVWVQSGEPVREPSPKKATSVRRTSEDVRPELDLRGKMVEEAIFAIDKYLDRAILAGYREVYLIHGKGTGALRAGVQQFLRNHPRVKRYRLGGHGEGGSGVTVVEL
ncbi:MAG: Smr/MutS family protein, partial [Planifilum sp.]